MKGIEWKDSNPYMLMWMVGSEHRPWLGEGRHTLIDWSPVGVIFCSALHWRLHVWINSEQLLLIWSLCFQFPFWSLSLWWMCKEPLRHLWQKTPGRRYDQILRNPDSTKEMTRTAEQNSASQFVKRPGIMWQKHLSHCSACLSLRAGEKASVWKEKRKTFPGPKHTRLQKLWVDICWPLVPTSPTSLLCSSWQGPPAEI